MAFTVTELTEYGSVSTPITSCDNKQDAILHALKLTARIQLKHSKLSSIFLRNDNGITSIALIELAGPAVSVINVERSINVNKECC